MNQIETLIFLASLCLPIWMGEVWNYVHSIEDLIEVLVEEDEIYECLRSYGYVL